MKLRLLPCSWLLVVLSLAAAPAEAQDRYTFTVGALGGLGGSLDANPGDSLSNTAYQLTAALITEPKTHLALRVGHLNLDDDEIFEELTEAGLDYVNISGEYRYDHAFYESGVYFGLGGYRLEGNPLDGGETRTDTSFGLVLGLTGEFELTRRLSFVIDLAGHWANLDDAQTFVTGQAGVAFHF